MHFESIFSFHGRIDSGIDEHELLPLTILNMKRFVKNVFTTLCILVIK